MEALGNIGSFLGNNAGAIGKIASVGSGVSGLVGNALAQDKRNQVLNQQLDLQKQYTNLTPDQLASQISQLQRPLSNGLTAGVGNAVQGQLAERGLSQAPGIFQDVLSQSLAPYYLQQQQMATQAWLQKMGLPIEAAARFLPYPETKDTSGIWRTILSAFNSKGGGAAGNTAPGADWSSLISKPDSSGNTNLSDSTGSIPSDAGSGDFNLFDLASQGVGA